LELTRVKYTDLGIQPKPPKEQEADAFASELLIPMEQLKKFQGDFKSPDKLAGNFQVSRPAMVIAVANLFGAAKYFR
jgi:Zn-dependent peptidase ImmA (M78 family)